MIRGQEAMRGARRAEAFRNLGVDVKLYRGLGTRADVAGSESQIMRLPVTAGDSPDLQDQVTGELYYTADFSDPFVDAVVM